MKITACNIGVFLKTDDIKDIVPIRDFPGIDIPGILVSVVPEKKGIDKSLLRGAVRVTGDHERILLLCFKKNLFITPSSGDEFFDIDQEDMCGFVRRKRVLGNFDPWNDQQSISIPRPFRLLCDVRHVSLKTVLFYRKVEPPRKFSKGIISIYHMVRNGNDIETCLAEKVHRPFKFHRPVGICCVDMQIAKQH